MPEIIFKSDQGAGVRKIIRIMQGDSRAHVIRFVVPRYASGVDLSPLTWYIKIVDAKNTPDIALPSGLYEVTAEDVRVRWTVNGAYTDVIGSTKFQLYGVGKDADGNVINWTGGAGEIEVTENIGFELSEDQQKELNALDKLIVFVQGELNNVIQAGNDAAAAAVRAEAAAVGAVDATAAANRANAAAERAEFASAIAEVKANALSATADGNPVQFSPDEHNIIKPVLTLLPVQSGSGEPSPSNIRPIAGRTGAELVRCGKNLLNAPSVININSETSVEGRVFEIPLHIPAGTYTFSIGGYTPDNNGQMELVFYYTLETWEEVYPVAFTDKHNTPWSFTFTSDKPIRHCSVYVRTRDDTYTIKNAMLELGSAATAYEPYQGDIFALNFGQTVYGGTLDWNKGEMVVNTGFAAFDGSENWVVFTYADGRQSFYTSGSNALPGIMSGTYIYGPGICSWSPSVDGYITDILRTDVDSAAIEIKPDVLSKWGIGDLDTFKARLAANPMQIAYKLANPITISLTPQQITALAGVNTVYGDADEITVHYNKSLNAAFEELKNAILAMGGNV